MEEIVIAELLGAEGFLGEAALRGRATLEAEGLTRPGKARMAAGKVGRAKVLLAERLARTCGADACLFQAGDREVVLVPPDHCEACGGSRNRRAGHAARRAILAVGVHRVLVVGGTRTTLADLRACLEGDGVMLRCINGTDGVRQPATIEADVAWAQVLLIWASTPLPHKVSKGYTERARGRLRVVTVPRRGVEAVCQELMRLAGAR